MPSALVVVGGSLGGFQAVKQILHGLPADFPVPLVIVLHRAGDALPSLLQRQTALIVVEAEDKEPLAAGRVYLGPAGYHLLVERGSFALSTEGPVWFARPSIDALFESAAEAYGETLIGVALTGSSQDGADGLAAIEQRGGLAVVQDPNSAESAVLPRAARQRTSASQVLPLSGIAPFLVERCQPLLRS